MVALAGAGIETAGTCRRLCHGTGETTGRCKPEGTSGAPTRPREGTRPVVADGVVVVMKVL